MFSSPSEFTPLPHSFTFLSAADPIIRYNADTSEAIAADEINNLAVNMLVSPQASSSPSIGESIASDPKAILYRVQPMEEAVQPEISQLGLDVLGMPEAESKSEENLTPVVKKLESKSPHFIDIEPSATLEEQKKVALRFHNVIGQLPQELIEEAIANKKGKELTFLGNEIQISNTGTVRLKLTPVGAGAFKLTELMMRLKKEHEVGPEEVLFEAFSAPTLAHVYRRTPLSRELYDERQIANELLLHKYIRSNASNFSHVCAARKVIKLETYLTGEPMRKGIITEFCNGGDVDGLIRKQKDLSLADKDLIASQMAKGVVQLHAAHIVHRDLKLDNFLIKRNAQGHIEQVKVADLGIASFTDVSKRYHTKLGPQTHRPPEYVSEEERFDPKGDVYQLGISLLQLFLQISTEEWVPIQGTLPRISSPDKFQAYIDNLPNDKVKGFISQMLAADPTVRPTMLQVEEFFRVTETEN